MAIPKSRQPKGQSDGGQFAPSQNPEATVQPTTFSEERTQPAPVTDGQWQSRAAEAERTLDSIVELARTPNLSGAVVVGALDEILIAAGFDVSWPKTKRTSSSIASQRIWPPLVAPSIMPTDTRRAVRGASEASGERSDRSGDSREIRKSLIDARDPSDRSQASVRLRYVTDRGRVSFSSSQRDGGSVSLSFRSATWSSPARDVIHAQ